MDSARAPRLRSVDDCGPPSAALKRRLRQSLVGWWRRTPSNRRSFPWRRPRLPAYRALVTEVLLQRTRAEAVAEAFEPFFIDFPDAVALSRARESRIRRAIRPLGLHWRARTLKAMGRRVSRGVPEDMASLVELPGVGPYAAGAFLSLHRGHRAVIPDSNVARILGRVLGFEVGPETRRRRAFLAICDALTPRTGFHDFNYGLLDLGREVCLPRAPKCPECPLEQHCSFARRGA